MLLESYPQSPLLIKSLLHTLPTLNFPLPPATSSTFLKNSMENSPSAFVPTLKQFNPSSSTQLNSVQLPTQSPSPSLQQAFRSPSPSSSDDSNSSPMQSPRKQLDGLDGTTASSCSPSDPSKKIPLQRTQQRKLIWTPELQREFVKSIQQLERSKVSPKRILHLMNVEGLTRANVASHLQKYRKRLQRTEAKKQKLASTAKGGISSPSSSSSSAASSSSNTLSLSLMNKPSPSKTFQFQTIQTIREENGASNGLEDNKNLIRHQITGQLSASFTTPSSPASAPSSLTTTTPASSPLSTLSALSSFCTATTPSQGVGSSDLNNRQRQNAGLPSVQQILESQRQEETMASLINALATNPVSSSSSSNPPPSLPSPSSASTSQFLPSLNPLSSLPSLSNAWMDTPSSLVRQQYDLATKLVQQQQQQQQQQQEQQQQQLVHLAAVAAAVGALSAFPSLPSPSASPSTTASSSSPSTPSSTTSSSLHENAIHLLQLQLQRQQQQEQQQQQLQHLQQLQQLQHLQQLQQLHQQQQQPFG